MTKITDEILTEVVASAVNVSDVLRRLNIRVAGGSHSHYSGRIKKLGLDTSHFTGSAWNRDRQSPKRKSASEILVVYPEGHPRPKTIQLRRALLDLGRIEQCEECGGGLVWNDLPLVLHVDHKDGDFLNCVEGNLRFLCPNCHSQTETFCRPKLASVVEWQTRSV